jgi:hypothetical protein
MTFQATDPLYRDQNDQFSAYLRLKETTSLIEGFFASGQLMRNLKAPDDWVDSNEFAVGLTGSIGRREAHASHSDYDVAVIARTRSARDEVLFRLIEPNPQANLERSALFRKDATYTQPMKA